MIFREACYALVGKDSDLTKRHTHQVVEFIQVKQGSGSVLKSNRSYPLEAGFLYIIDARCPHIVYPQNCEEYIRNKIVIDFTSFCDFCDGIGLNDFPEDICNIPPIPTENEPEIDALFLTVSRLVNSKNNENIAFAHGYIIKLLQYVFSCKEAQLPTTQNSVVQKALDIIRTSGEKTSLLDISEKLHLNKYYLCHIFHEKTGITLTEYISEKRYEKSLHLLKTTDNSIESISEQCGFEYLSSFTRFFTKRCGMSPLKYRKSFNRVLK